MTKKKYRVWAKMTSWSYIDVETEDGNEAIAIGKNTDGGEFTSVDEGDWEVMYAEPIDK